MNVELLSPAGDFETALAAFSAGADAVYCGLPEYSARAFATNLSFERLADLVAFAHAATPRRRVYVTFNTLLDEDETERAVEALARLEEIGPDALIVQDLGVARLCRRHFPGLELHASTQLVAHNLEGVLAMRDFGFRRVVLARELPLADIADIARRSGALKEPGPDGRAPFELECFIHGALCYSISGLCLFSAMEKGRSGNRGRCAYCCRESFADAQGRRTLPFSMKDLRLSEDVRKLADAGVASLKIEGRMKSALYVASVTKHYREILDGTKRTVSRADLETVFSRRTTELYFNGDPAESPIDARSLGHLGTPIGSLKRITRDREGRRWLRFHTSRALERHDGIQFAAPDGGKPLGFGIGDMRTALSRAPVFEVAAGTDVELALPEDDGNDWSSLPTGATVYCSMSNAVKRAFPAPAWREGAIPGNRQIDVTVRLRTDRVTAETGCGGERLEVVAQGEFGAAKSPERTFAAIEKALGKLGGTRYRLGRLELDDPDRLFAPMSVLNDLRRDLVEKLDEASERLRREKTERALAEDAGGAFDGPRGLKRVKIRLGQSVPPGEWDETVVAISRDDRPDSPCAASLSPECRLAVPVYTPEGSFNRLRSAVKAFLRAGYAKWEASDLATLRMLKSLGVTDLTADWTLYAFNHQALAALSEMGVKRFTASPENGRENLAYLAESGYDVEFISQQSTPLFVSRTRPSADSPEGLAVCERDGLWVTTRPVPRVFAVPDGASSRLDLSWSPS